MWVRKEFGLQLNSRQFPVYLVNLSGGMRVEKGSTHVAVVDAIRQRSYLQHCTLCDHHL